SRQHDNRKLLQILLSSKSRLLFYLPDSKRDHEANAVVFRDCTDPPFLMNITPTWKRQHSPSLAVSLRREKKKLHAFFSHPDLGDPLRLFVIKNAAADRAKIGELVWNIVVFKPVFHKEQIT